MSARVRTYTLWDEFLVWWELHGELDLELVRYYIVCSLIGWISGQQIGAWIIRGLA